MLTLITPSQDVNALSADTNFPAPARAVDTIQY